MPGSDDEGPRPELTADGTRACDRDPVGVTSHLRRMEAMDDLHARLGGTNPETLVQVRPIHYVGGKGVGAVLDNRAAGRHEANVGNLADYAVSRQIEALEGPPADQAAACDSTPAPFASV